MKSSIRFTNKKQIASFWIVGLVLAIASLGLMLNPVKVPVHAQTSDEVSSSSTTPSPADWTEFHRDNMQRWNPYETVLSVNNVGSLQVKWRKPVGMANALQPSSPAVVNGVLYFGSEGNNVYALNASTGAKLWTFSTGSSSALGMDSSPAVANGVVYIGSGDSNVYALNARTGAQLWRFTTGSYVYSSPAVANGVVYIGSCDGNVYALNASTGAKLWTYATGDCVYSSPAVANGVVYIGSDDFNVYALNATSGAKLWSYDTGGKVDSSPAVANGVVYIIGGTDPFEGFAFVYALNASTGAQLWNVFAGVQSQYASPAVANGVVYFASQDAVHALNTSTGATLWSYSVASSQFVYSAPALANGVVYFTSIPSGTSTNDGFVYALNAGSGLKLWSHSTTGHMKPSFVSITSPTVVDGVVYVRAGDQSGEASNVYAFSVGADLFLRILPTPTTVHQGDLITYAFPVWNLGPDNAVHEVLNTEVPAGTTFDYIRISGTPGLGTCTHPPYQGTGQIICHENGSMAPNTTWTVRLTVKVTAPSGTVITANAATMADTPDPNMANNMATSSIKVQ